VTLVDLHLGSQWFCKRFPQVPIPWTPSSSTVAILDEEYEEKRQEVSFPSRTLREWIVSQHDTDTDADSSSSDTEDSSSSSFDTDQPSRPHHTDDDLLLPFVVQDDWDIDMIDPDGPPEQEDTYELDDDDMIWVCTLNEKRHVPTLWDRKKIFYTWFQ